MDPLVFVVYFFVLPPSPYFKHFSKINKAKYYFYSHFPEDEKPQILILSH